jgi:hypothetical protein
MRCHHIWIAPRKRRQTEGVAIGFFQQLRIQQSPIEASRHTCDDSQWPLRINHVLSVSNLDLFIVIDGGFRKYFIRNNDRPCKKVS